MSAVPSNVEDGDPAAALMQLLGGSRVSQVVHVAAQLGIADHLTEGPCHVSILAEKVHAHEASLLRLMRALVALGVFAETETPGTFRVTPISQRLVANHAQSLRYVAIYNGIPEVHNSWGHLLHSVRTGESAFQSLHGSDMFSYMAKSKDTADAYNRAMTEFSSADAEAILAAYDFSRFSTILDIGGGEGQLLYRVLEQHPNLKGTLLELPAVASGAKERVSQWASGVRNRCHVLEGSFLETFPVAEAASACMLKNILLNWDDDSVLQILRSCHQALAPDGKVLVIEPIVGEEGQGPSVCLIDINMLVVCPGGKLRTRAEHEDLLREAGFLLDRIVQTKSTMRIIQGRKV